ncbi:hypothetical protein GCM10010343_17810 [Streptomyces avidinii]|nr:hypothetical protein GCM10010343_17810 [Streptomyces avidinii]
MVDEAGDLGEHAFLKLDYRVRAAESTPPRAPDGEGAAVTRVTFKTVRAPGNARSRRRVEGIVVDGRRRCPQMSTSGKVAVAGVVAAIVLFWAVGFWAGLLVLIGVPAAAYLLLDSSQRRRLRGMSRKQIGR